MYADDTNIFTTGTNLVQGVSRMNTGLRAVEQQWMYDNRLTVNVDKNPFHVAKTETIAVRCRL